MKPCKTKLKLKYPCQWIYKVIGIDQMRLKNAISEILGNQEYLIEYSNSSKTGKYHSLNVEVIVHTEESRNTIYKGLKNHPHIKIVL